MTGTTMAAAGEIEAFRHLTRMTDQVVRINVAGVTQAESLAQPNPGGNCLNWALGHLVAVYENALPLVRQQPVLPAGAMKRYDRGSAPITDGSEARDFGELVRLWEEQVKRMDAGLSTLTPEYLDQPAPFSPTGNEKETVRTLVGTIVFHQTYHAGQTGLLRRISGKEGAIK